MKNLALLAGGLAAAGVAAHPLTSRQSANIDPTILQFALTLEHLENAFYKGALQNFTLADFQAAGYSSTYYNNIKYISYDEQSHVQLLSQALTAAGVTPVAACTYKFPYTDVNSFVTLSSVLEGVGTSAYLAGAPLITSKGYLTVAGSILVTEALHTSYQRAAIGEVPMANPYGTPLDPTAVFTLAAGFIVSCPSSNAPLPFTPFPALTYDAAGNCRCEEPDCAPSAAIKRSEPEHTSLTPAEAAWEDWSHTASAAAASETGSGPRHEAPSPTASASSAGSYGSGAAPMSTGSADHGYGSESSAKPTSAPAKPTMTMSYPESGFKTVTESCSATSSGSYGAPPPKPSGGSYCAPPSAGSVIKFTAASPIPAGSYVTFVSGLAVVSVKGTISGSDITAAIPSVAMGQTYVLISSTDQEGAVDDTKVLFGPAIVEVAPPAPVIDFSQI